MTRDEMNEIRRHFDVVAESLVPFRLLSPSLCLTPDLDEPSATSVCFLADQVGTVLVDTIEQVAEGHQVLVKGQERIFARLDRLETRIDRFEPELKGMVNLSFSELDCRVRALEASVAALAGRVKRLEGGRPA